MLLGIALVVSVNSYQKKQHKNRIDDLESYAEVLDSSIVQLNGVIDAIYSNDSSFEGIDQYRTILEELDYTYVFRNLLKMQVQANRNLKGLFLYYDNFDKVLYSVNEKISYGEKEALKQGGMNFGLAIGNQIYTQESYVIKNEEHVFLIF